MEVCVCLSVSLFLCPRLCLRLCLCLGCLGFYLVLYVSFSISVSPPPVGFSAKILHLGTSPRYSAMVHHRVHGHGTWSAVEE